jgi:hypothetical protein
MRIGTRVGAAAAGLLFVLWSGGVFAQEKPVPKPFPKPADPAPTKPIQPKQALPPAPAPTEVPTEATLGVPIYQGAQFLTSYDAGQGQRFYIFGVAAGFDDVVAWYRSALKLKGDLVFEVPPTHMFEMGRYKEDAMAFPPGVTVKDYSWGGMTGYPNPKRGGEPARFNTIIQIVPVPPGGSH